MLTVGGMAIAPVQTVKPGPDGLEIRKGALEQRQARLEGLIEG